MKTNERTIYKYPLNITDEQTINLPEGAKILHAGLDPQGVPCLWAAVYPANPSIPTVIYIIGTGWEMPKAADGHIGSFIQGPFVWHVFI